MKTTKTLKYEPLERYLRERATEKPELTLTFAEIEQIIRARLPASSWTHREWWGNQKETSTRPQARAWLSAGFEVDYVKQDKERGHVRFTRKAK